MNITCLHKEQNPFVPSHISPRVQQRKGSQVMYNILNKNNEIPAGKLTRNKLYMFQEEEWKQIYIYPFKITNYSVIRWIQICINYFVI